MEVFNQTIFDFRHQLIDNTMNMNSTDLWFAFVSHVFHKYF